ncbi:MAG: ABC transporter substrate-binding protein [Lachnospiraceae bacterium]|nr:ABC transporter substrate-binding protein [Lachnospiraceae bacterium]
MKLKNIKKIFALVLSFALVLGLVACGSSKDTSKTSDKKELKKLEVTAGNNMVSSALTVIAKYAGYFEEEGLDVNLTPTASNAYEPLLTGKLDITSGGAPQPLELIDHGDKLVMFAGAMGNGAGIYSLPERADEFKELNNESLAGKKIGVTRGTSGLFGFVDWLQKNDIDYTKIEWVELDSIPTIIEAIRKGEIDLGLIYLTFRLTAEEQGLNRVTHIDDLEEFICCRLTTTPEKLEENRDDYVAFTRAIIKAYHLLNTDQDSSVKYMKEYMEIDEEVIRNQLFEYGHLTLDPNPAKDKIIDFYNSMKLLGYVDGNADVAQNVDSTIFKDAIEQIIEENPDDEIYKALYEEYKETNTK